MKVSADVIERIRNMNVPVMNTEEQDYSEGYSNALDDVVDLLENISNESDDWFSDDGVSHVLGGK